MNYKKISKKYFKLNTSYFNLSNPIRFNKGIIYTLYSDKFNLLEVGFAENNRVLNNIMIMKGYILLDKKEGNKQDLKLLIDTLNGFGIKFSDSLNYQYSNNLMRHLSTLGWPIGSSLFKPRKIKKEFMCA